MKACILEHKMLASRETHQLVICPTSQQVKKKKGEIIFFPARINLNTRSFCLLIFQFSSKHEMDWNISQEGRTLMFVIYYFDLIVRNYVNGLPICNHAPCTEILITLFINIHDSPYYSGYYPILLYVMPHEYHMGEGFRKGYRLISVLYSTQKTQEKQFFSKIQRV